MQIKLGWQKSFRRRGFGFLGKIYVWETAEGYFFTSYKKKKKHVPKGYKLLWKSYWFWRLLLVIIYQ